MVLVFLSSIPVSVSAARGRARGRYARPTGQGNAQRSRAGDATTPHAGAVSSAAAVARQMAAAARQMAAAAATPTAPAAATAMLALSRSGDATAPHAGAASSAAVSSSASGGGTAGGSGSGSIDSYSSYSSGCVETRAESTCNVDYKSERSVQQQRRRNRRVRSAKKIAFEEAEARITCAASRIRNAACACETRFDAIVKASHESALFVD